MNTIGRLLATVRNGFFLAYEKVIGRLIAVAFLVYAVAIGAWYAPVILILFVAAYRGFNVMTVVDFALMEYHDKDKVYDTTWMDGPTFKMYMVVANALKPQDGKDVEIDADRLRRVENHLIRLRRIYRFLFWGALVEMIGMLAYLLAIIIPALG